MKRITATLLSLISAFVISLVFFSPNANAAMDTSRGKIVACGTHKNTSYVGNYLGVRVYRPAAGDNNLFILACGPNGNGTVYKYSTSRKDWIRVMSNVRDFSVKKVGDRFQVAWIAPSNDTFVGYLNPNATLGPYNWFRAPGLVIRGIASGQQGQIGVSYTTTSGGTSGGWRNFP